MPATVIAVGQPANDSERRAIAALRDGLPQGYVVIHNFELRVGRQVYEIDLAVVAPHCLYVADVKGTRGQIEVYGAKWYPENHAPFNSPLAKLRTHAKVLKSLICDAHPTRPELKRIYVHAAVILTAPDAKLVDPNQVDRHDVTDLAGCVGYFQSKGTIPQNFATDIRQFHNSIFKALTPQVKPKSSAARFGSWEVEEKLGGTERYTDYRAHRASSAGAAGGVKARLRVYASDPYQETKDREAERRLIENAYRALERMPGHPHILNVRDFFETEEGDRFVLVTEDVAGRPLSQHVRRPDLALTFDQKLTVVRGVLGALAHAHGAKVIHRRLTPDAILVGADAEPRLCEFDYARGGQRTTTIAGQIGEEFDTPYLAPECYLDPEKASPLSDLYAAGAVFYELLTGQPPFVSFDQMLDCDAVFPQHASELQGDLPKGLDGWLQKLCSFKREDRHQSAPEALEDLERVLAASGGGAQAKPAAEKPSEARQPVAQLDYNALAEGTELSRRYVVKERLGGGGFAVAYKVFDSWGGVPRVMKIVTRDRISQFDRFRKEYQTLLRLQDHPHPHVVKLIHGDTLSDGTLFILFDYLEGLTVEKCLEDKSLSLEDACEVLRQTAEGLRHLHGRGIYHHDIKPSNLLWTEQGVKIFDFNVATTDADAGAGGGTRRYLPPDYDADDEQTPAEKVDRDLYALGLVFYQCVTGRYPFDAPTPPPKQPPRDPRESEPGRELSPELAQLMARVIAPARADRFPSAALLLEALQGVKNLRRLPAPEPGAGETLPALTDGWPSDRPNYNPFVTALLTLYSQSRRSNAGTRGLDKIGAATYVRTLLDDELRPAVLGGEFRLVIISGNAGDGKTAFIQKLERRAEKDGAAVECGANGSRFAFRGRRFYSNYDGSQDEGEKVNDEVLHEFLGPFAGGDEAAWPAGETRLIAINEGRLVDFLSTHAERYPRLSELAGEGLRGGPPAAGVAVINLNLRAVVADPDGENSSIFDRLIRRLTREEFWQACAGCDLRDRCYVQHNYRTLSDPVAGPKVIERLKTLHTVTHLRGRLHVTLRDLRSALALMLAGTRDCDEIHRLYAATDEGAPQAILNGFYFNAWLGGEAGSADRLVRLLGEIDVGEVSDPELDRRLDFLEPRAGELGRFGFAGRGGYDDELLGRLFQDLKRGYVAEGEAARVMKAHRGYVAMLRRRHYFERRDEGWGEMLPYRGAGRFLRLVLQGADLSEECRLLLLAINRGEGVTRPELLNRALALRVREVKGGTIRSYRLFDGAGFALERRDDAARARFVEHLPQSLRLSYETGGRRAAELNVTLDIYEMLTRLNDGYRPSSEERQGLYLRLAVFKNTLAAAPYQEVLLTETGHEFYRIAREESGVLTMSKVERSAA
jgi:serine/threonine protein kinase